MNFRCFHECVCLFPPIYAVLFTRFLWITKGNCSMFMRLVMRPSLGSNSCLVGRLISGSPATLFIDASRLSLPAHGIHLRSMGLRLLFSSQCLMYSVRSLISIIISIAPFLRQTYSLPNPLSFFISQWNINFAFPWLFE